ncbi:MAG: cobalamin B12-binding domain-containing protein [Desulfobacterales bacterium]|nr:MAG: cobalamin B12-binding domain-containing protein [Desulfobacterales bacterium]
MVKKPKKRILIAKPGLDGHDRGAKVVARALRNAGMEIIYAGLHLTPLQIVNTAIDEDVDAIGLSVLSGAHLTVFGKVMDLLRKKGISHILVFGGGTIPQRDRSLLLSMGVGELFPPGTETQAIIDYLNDAL